MEILHAAVEDAPTILALQKAAFLSEGALHDNLNIPPLTQTLDELIKDFKLKAILKIEEDGKLLASGQVQYVDGICHIGRMAVWPKLQGKGIGSFLLKSLEGV
jgi:GNAT superfamily N-acetyltransferase